MRTYLLFIDDIAEPMRAYAPDKKAAHEIGQRTYPGKAIQAYSEVELIHTQVVERETENVVRWLDVLKQAIGELTDPKLARERIARARKCLDVLDTHFAAEGIP